MLNITKIFIFTVVVLFLCFVDKAYACCGCCCSIRSTCGEVCTQVSKCQTGAPDDPKTTLGHTTKEFDDHRVWMVEVFFKDPKPNDQPGLLAAMMLMTEQFSANMMQQVQIIGAFLDAKFQLETQRLFQKLTARAHKDYHPSEGMCEIGTNIVSIASSERNTKLTKMTLAKRSIHRQLLSGGTSAAESTQSDKLARLGQFVDTYCNPKDNAGGLELLCMQGSGVDPERYNKDVDFTQTVDAPLTLKIDFTPEGDPDHESAPLSPDEEDVLALMSNLYAHDVAPLIENNLLELRGNQQLNDASERLLDLRAITAKRSVGQNSLSSIIALKSQGEEDVEPFLYSLLEHLSEGENFKLSPEEIEKYLGDRPSYFAQMEMMTKKIYQDPNFYVDLYDKPANVKRKRVALQAIDLMQKRDIYQSFLRSEAILSVMLETQLARQQDKISNEINRLKQQ